MPVGAPWRIEGRLRPSLGVGVGPFENYTGRISLSACAPAAWTAAFAVRGPGLRHRRIRRGSGSVVATARSRGAVAPSSVPVLGPRALRFDRGRVLNLRPRMMRPDR